MGRPTKYNQELLEKAREYVEQERTLNASPDGSFKSLLPTIEGLARACGISMATVHEWRSHEDKEEFSDIVEDLLTKQADYLIYGGLSGTFTSNVAKMLLGKHGYSDRVETDNRTQLDFSGLSDEQLYAIIHGTE